MSLKQAVENIEKSRLISLTKNARDENKKRKAGDSRFDHIRWLAVYRFLQLLLQDANEGRKGTKIARSAQVCSVLFDKSSPTTNKSKLLLEWAKYFLANGSLPQSQQGKHAKIKSIIENHVYRNTILEFLAKQNPNSISSRLLQRFAEKVSITVLIVI